MADWQPHEDATLRKGAADGKSMSAVAALLPRRTRNMVAGRADRLGVKFGTKVTCPNCGHHLVTNG